MFGSKKLELPTRDQALPGRETAMPVPAAHYVNGHALAPPYPEGTETMVVGMGCFWGAERTFWSLPGRVGHRRRLRGRDHAQPDLRGGVLGPDRPHRGRAGGVRPGADQLRGAAQGVLGAPRPDAGHAPGQRQGHAVPLGHLHVRPRAAGDRRAFGGRLQRAAGQRPATGPSPPRSPSPASSTSPRTTTSSTWPRTRTGTAASAAPACPVPSAWPPPTDPHPGAVVRRRDGRSG